MAVISACVKGDVACARAAVLLSLSIRQVRLLKRRLRDDGRRSGSRQPRTTQTPRRLPDRVRRSILRQARTTHAGFNDHHLEKHRDGVGKRHRAHSAYLPVLGSQTGVPFASRKVKVSVPFTISRARITSDCSCFTLDPVNEIWSPFVKVIPISS